MTSRPVEVYVTAAPRWRCRFCLAEVKRAVAVAHDSALGHCDWVICGGCAKRVGEEGARI